MTFRPFGAYLLQKICLLSKIVSSSVLCCAKQLYGVQQIGSDMSAQNGYVMGQALNARNEICETSGFQLWSGCHRSCLPVWKGGFLAPTQWNWGPAFQQLLKHLIVVYPSFCVHSCFVSFLHFISCYLFFLLGTSTFFLFNSWVVLWEALHKRDMDFLAPKSSVE